MATTVLLLDEQTIQQLGDIYQDAIHQIPPHAYYQLKLPSLSVTAYKSGKVVLQGTAIDEFIQKNHLIDATNTSSSNKSATGLPEDFSTWSVIGSDEVGTGSYFGPLTVACAFVPKDKIKTLQLLGVKDSKNLTDAQIQEIVPKIKELVPYKLLTLWPEKYNEVQQTKNLNEMKALLHNQAIKLLYQQLNPETVQAVLIDEFCSPKNYYRYLQEQTTPLKSMTYFKTKGESHHIAVAAASMIARDSFLEGLKTLSKEYGYKLLSGAHTDVDELASKILEYDGMEVLSKVAKLHFANTQKAIDLAK